MLCDDHVHSIPLSPDASQPMREACQEAIEKGLNRVCFTEHLSQKNYFPYSGPYEEPEYNYSAGDFSAALSEVEELRGEFPGLDVGFGVEADYFPGREGELKDLLNAVPFDFVLGSVHYLNGWCVAARSCAPDCEALGEEALYDGYFSLLFSAVETGLFDSMAHVDLFKRTGSIAFGSVNYSLYGDKWPELGKLMAANNAALELNTAGEHRYGVGVHPGKKARDALFEAGVRLVTVGSDAHHAGQIGLGCAEARDTAKKEGFKTVFYGKRKPVEY